MNQLYKAARKAIAQRERLNTVAMGGELFVQCGGHVGDMMFSRCDKCGAVIESSGGVCARLVQITEGGK